MNMNNLETRNLDASHTLEIINLYKTYRVTTYPEEQIEHILDTFPSLGVFANTELIAFCYTEFFAPDVIEISSIFVHRDWRRKGIGTALLHRTHTQAIQEGYKAAILSNSLLYKTKERKEHARHFYERMGYTCCLHTGNTGIYVRPLCSY